MKNVEFVKPSGLFTNYIYKAIPLVFDESMSYYETLAGLLAYLKNTINPAVNNNAMVLKELEEYVVHYFDNLDVQEEINNKLDEMASSGQLTDIIAQYLDLAGVLAYNVVADMVEAENITDGSICRTLGKDTYDDGKGSFYKIRTLTSGDEIDGVNIIALDVSDTLIAEKINDYYIEELSNSIGDITEDIGDINTNLTTLNNERETEIVVFGDSWSDLSVTGVLWPTMVASALHLNLHDYALSGAGFVKPVNNLISSQITTATADTSYNKNNVKYVVLAGGINDFLSSVSATDLITEIISVYNNCKTLFPNAKILYVSNFKYPYENNQTNYWYTVQYQLTSVGINTLNQDGYFKKAFFVSNLFHLTEPGQTVFGSNIISALSGGQIKNNGVNIALNNSKGHIWLKRVENLLMYVIKLENLDTTSSTETLTPADEICWGADLDLYLMGSVGLGYNRAVCQVNIDGTITVAKESATTASVAFNGVTAIVVDV